MRSMIALLLLIAASTSSAESLDFDFGKLHIIETEDTATIQAANENIIDVKIEPGGRLWPPIITDDSGKMFVGNLILDIGSGVIERSEQKSILVIGKNTKARALDQSHAIEINHKGKKCEIKLSALGHKKTNGSASMLLQTSKIFLRASENRIVSLNTYELKNSLYSYKLYTIDPFSCKVKNKRRLGLSGFYSEVGYSQKGAWWSLGFNDRALAVSYDGLQWKIIQLPEEIYGLADAFVVDKNEMWLSAAFEGKTESGHLRLLKSSDGGKTWDPIERNAESIKKIPRFWMAGHRALLIPAGK